MRRDILVGAAAIMLLAGLPARAADLPMEPPPAAASVPSFSWTGPYVGVQAGYARGRTRSAGFNDFTTRSDRLRPDGALIGAYLGYNRQLDASPVVLGLEADIAWSDQSDKLSYRSPPRVVPTRFDEKNAVQWSGAVRGRVGLAFDRFMIYAAGGLAVARRKVDFSYVSLPGPVSAGSESEKKTALGWTVGGGVEAALADAIVARAEYRYTDFGFERLRRAFGSDRTQLTEQRLTGGLAYKF